MHLTTLSHWAFLGDSLILYLYLRLSDDWNRQQWTLGLSLLASWMILSKFTKLFGHYIRYPADFLLLPVSITFGYLHGLIKAYALLTLNVVSPAFPTPSHTRDFFDHLAQFVFRPRLAILLANRRSQTAWGSREGADDDDAFRMIRVSQKHFEATVTHPTPMFTQ